MSSDVAEPTNPDADGELVDERARLLDIAFRMLGSTDDATRLVDLTFVRWREISREFSTGAPDSMRSRRDGLTEILARTCFEFLSEARGARGQYLGDWLPEPLPHTNATRPPTSAARVDRITLDESLDMLLLVVLESLTPEERVAFILHDVFGVSFHGIAEVVGRSRDDTRELAHSARTQIQLRTKHELSPERRRSIVLTLLAGCEANDETEVQSTLHPEVTVLVDDGGTVPDNPSPVRGVEQAARLLLRLFASAPAMTVSEQSVNGHAGLVFRRAHRVIGVLSVNVTADKIIDVWIVLNPDKLHHWNRE